MGVMESFASEPEVEGEIAALNAAIARFCERPVPEGGPATASYLEQLRPAIDKLELRFSEAAAAFAATDHYDGLGFVSPIHWIRTVCHMSAGAAADRVAVGDQLHRVPESHQSVLDGGIGFAHLALIARTAAAIQETATNQPFDENPLLEKARELNIGRFRDFNYHMRHAADPVGYAAAEVQAVDARSFSIKAGEGGMVWVRGVLDPEGGAVLRTAAESLARRNGHEDDRKLDRRLADAVVEMAARSLDSGLLPKRAGQRPHLQVTATLETLAQRMGVPAADLERCLPISGTVLERLAYDCVITRVVLSSESAVIDVGRSKRVITPAQSRALTVRDKGCRWPGCDRPATWTSGHHLVHWLKGGTTDLTNLVLLCYRHHWMVHEGKWQLIKTEGGKLLAIPPQMDLFARLARGPDTETVP
jgi:hypothetical protein